MTTPTIHDTDVKVNLDRLEDRIRTAQKLKLEVAEANAFIADVEKEVQATILAAGGTIGTIRGVSYFSYRPTKAARWSALMQEQAALAAPYMRTKTVEELDKDAFRAAHPAVFAKYQSRTFLNLPVG